MFNGIYTYHADAPERFEILANGKRREYRLLLQDKYHEDEFFKDLFYRKGEYSQYVSVQSLVLELLADQENRQTKHQARKLSLLAAIWQATRKSN